MDETQQGMPGNLPESIYIIRSLKWVLMHRLSICGLGGLASDTWQALMKRVSLVKQINKGLSNYVTCRLVRCSPAIHTHSGSSIGPPQT